MRGNWIVDYLKKDLPNAKLELVDTIADTVRLVAQGRADAIVENIDFFMTHTKNYPDVKWKVAAQSDRCRLLRDRRAAGQLSAARRAQHHPLQPAFQRLRQ